MFPSKGRCPKEAGSLAEEAGGLVSAAGWWEVAGQELGEEAKKLAAALSWGWVLRVYCWVGWWAARAYS